MTGADLASRARGEARPRRAARDTSWQPLRRPGGSRARKCPVDEAVGLVRKLLQEAG